MLPYLANMIVLFAVSPIADRLHNSGRISTTNVRKLFITLGMFGWLFWQYSDDGLNPTIKVLYYVGLCLLAT